MSILTNPSRSTLRITQIDADYSIEVKLHHNPSTGGSVDIPASDLLILALAKIVSEAREPFQEAVQAVQAAFQDMGGKDARTAAEGFNRVIGIEVYNAN